MAKKNQAANTNHLLHWRNVRNLSLEQLSVKLSATGIGYASANTLNRWEKGETVIKPWAIPALAKIYKITEDELLHGPREANSMLPTQVSAAYTGLDLEIAEQVISMGYTCWIASRPQEARQAVERVLPWLETMERRSPLSPFAKQGKHLLSRGYELLGVLALDNLENDTAISQFRRALTMSEELRDPNLIAAHTTELGDAYRRKGDKTTAIALIETALDTSQQIQRATHGYVLEMLAYTHADVGHESEFTRYIETAIDLLGHSGEGEGAGRREFIPFEVLEIYGKVMRDFGHPTEALTYLDRAEDALRIRPNVPRWHAVLTISRAQALCDAGELEAGVAAAIHGLTLAHSCQSPRQMNRVRKLKNKLNTSEYRDEPALIPLREVVADVYSGNRSPLDWHPKHGM